MKIKKRKFIVMLILTALAIYSLVCFFIPEQAESVARGFSIIINLAGLL